MSKNPLIKAAMEKQNLIAKNQLANKLGVARQVLTNWEERSLPDCINTLKLLEMSGKSAGEMLKELERQRGSMTSALVYILGGMSVFFVMYMIFDHQIISLITATRDSIHYAK